MRDAWIYDKAVKERKGMGTKMQELKGLLATNIGTMRQAMHEHQLKVKKPTLKMVLITIAIVVGIAILIYALYRFFSPDYLDDFEDDFDDDFDDDFFDDDIDDLDEAGE